MSVNVFESRGIFENRLYIAKVDDIETIKSSVKTNNGKELKGAGCRSYGKIAGKILSIFGLSSKLKIGDKTFYVNNRSFTELAIRINFVYSKGSLKENAEKLHRLYLDQKVPKKIKEIANNELKNFVKSKGEINNENIIELTNYLILSFE